MALGDALVALGGAFPAAGLLARFGRKIELPTIPLLMVAGLPAAERRRRAPVRARGRLGVLGGARPGGNHGHLVVTFIGFTLLVAGISEELGVKYAIAALMVGIIFGATTARDRSTHLVHPLRDAFGALFFFAFGLTIDPSDILSVLVPVLIAVVVTFVLSVAAGIIAARARELGAPEGVNIGLTLVSRGGFALVLGSLAAAAGLDARLLPFVAGYVVIPARLLGR